MTLTISTKLPTYMGKLRTFSFSRHWTFHRKFHKISFSYSISDALPVHSVEFTEILSHTFYTKIS